VETYSRSLGDLFEMQTSADEVAFLGLLCRLLGARKVVEVGVFTGFGTLALARAVPADGRVVALDITDKWLSAGRAAWAEAGVAERVDLRVGDARASLASLLAADGPGSFDLAFIDADKTSVGDYYEACLALVRPGGVVAVDNTLWGGAVVDPLVDDASTRAIRALNARIHADERVDPVMLPIADGLTLARKR
jgi:O-methyltransferase